MNLSALTQAQAAALLSISPRTLRDWHDAPRNADATYPGPALVAYAIAKSGAANEFDDQRQRLAAAQAEKVEHENAIRRGELALRGDVLRIWTDCIANARARILGLGTKLSTQLVNIADPIIIAAAIRAEAYAALTELADYDPSPRRRDGVAPGSESGVEAAPEPDGEPVGRPRKKVKRRKQRRARSVEN